MNKIEKGFIGQRAAENYLLDRGCRVLERNFRSKAGEIDLIIEDGIYTAFVEVKYRLNLQYGYPREAVTVFKQRRIKKAALFYIVKNQAVNRDFRFDVVEIIQNNDNGEMEITHIINAFS